MPSIYVQDGVLRWVRNNCLLQSEVCSDNRPRSVILGPARQRYCPDGDLLNGGIAQTGSSSGDAPAYISTQSGQCTVQTVRKVDFAKSSTRLTLSIMDELQ